MRVVFIIASYLLGAIPTGYLAFRLTANKDIRQFGSRSTGATNVLRVRGWRAALPVAVFDVLKGFLPAALALRIFHDQNWAAGAALAAIVGHTFPVYIRFRGGKGVAAAMGAYLALSLEPFLLGLAVFLVTIAATRLVSLGSLLAAISVPVSQYLLKGASPLTAWFLIIGALLVFNHRDNISRLLQGKERRLGEKSA
jgi:glycerol-3-phosphate acyltransferase PlsY